MKKTLKFVWKTILWILAVVVVAVLTLPLWIGPVAKTVANRTVPGITGTAFNLGDFGLNFYTGNFRVGAVTLYNPQGYDPREAFGLGALKVDMQVFGSSFERPLTLYGVFDMSVDRTGDIVVKSRDVYTINGYGFQGGEFRM